MGRQCRFVRHIYILAVLCCALLAGAQPVPIKVKIEANRSNQEQLLRALNSRGTKYKMAFSLTDRGYDYRIAFGTGKTQEQYVVGSGGNVTGGTADYDTGTAIVYDASDQELFRLKHEAWWNEASAISGTAKDIVNRVHKWRTEHPK
jgi:hypothetical protein